MNSGEGIDAGQIFNRDEILVASSGNQLDPAPRGQGSLWTGKQDSPRWLRRAWRHTSWDRGCQRNCLAPPISTTNLSRGSRWLSDTSEANSADDNT